MFFILSKDQHNQLQAIVQAKGLRNMNEALDFALGEVSEPLMEEWHAKREAYNALRRERFEKRRRTSKKGRPHARAGS